MTCDICKSDKNLERHRIIPGIKGGKYIPENIVMVCSTCHKQIHWFINRLNANKLEEYKLAIFKVKRLSKIYRRRKTMMNKMKMS